MSSSPSIDPKALFGDVQANWGWLLAFGIASLVLGTIGLGSCFALTLAGVVLFGWLIVIAGVVGLVNVFKSAGWKGRFWQLLISLFHLAAGVIVISDPLLASGVLTLFLAFSILASGAARIVVALQHRGQRGWLWLLLGGVAGVLLGGMIAARWPASSFFVIGLFIAIELIANGWTMVLVALAARSAGDRPQAAQPA